MITFLIYKDNNGKRHAGLPPLDNSWVTNKTANIDISLFRWIDKFIPKAYEDSYNLKTIDEIPPGEKYVIYLHYYESLTVEFEFDFTFHNPNNSRVSFPMPKRIWEDSGKGLVHWVFDHSPETTLLHHVDSFDDFKAAFNIRDAKNMTMISGIESNGKYGHMVKEECKEHGYNVITGYGFFGPWHLLGAWTSSENNRYVRTKIKNIFNNVPSKYKSLCYARVPRHNKMLATAYIFHHGLDKESLFSLGVNINDKLRYDNPERKTDIDILKLSDKDLIKVYQNLEASTEVIYPHIKEPDLDLLIDNPVQVISKEHGYQSYFQLTNETIIGDYTRYPFITEKSYKPFIMFQPFVMNGSLGCVQVLKERGFDVFEKWIDHSYDSIIDNTERWEKALAEFKRLHKLSHDQWNIMQREMLEGLIHNNNHATRLPPRLIATQLFAILIRFYH